MKKYLNGLLISGLMVTVGAAALPVPAGAIDPIGSKHCTGSNRNTAVCRSQGDRADNLIGNVVNILMFILGAVSTIMIIVGGLKYVTSNGDSNSIQSAKTTILYSVVGLVVAISASAIVSFVLGQL